MTSMRQEPLVASADEPLLLDSYPREYDVAEVHACIVNGDVKTTWEAIRHERTKESGGGRMWAVIVYESMFGNTHAIADAVGKGLEPMLEVVVVPLAEAGGERLGDADLLVVGGPTHFHGMSRRGTRKWAAATAQKPGNDLVLDRDADGPGVRDWLVSLGHGDTKVGVAFDTRFYAVAAVRQRAPRQASYRAASPMRTVRDDHRPRRRDG